MILEVENRKEIFYFLLDFYYTRSLCFKWQKTETALRNELIHWLNLNEICEYFRVPLESGLPSVSLGCCFWVLSSSFAHMNGSFWGYLTALVIWMTPLKLAIWWLLPSFTTLQSWKARMNASLFQKSLFIGSLVFISSYWIIWPFLNQLSSMVVTDLGSISPKPSNRMGSGWFPKRRWDAMQRTTDIHCC